MPIERWHYGKLILLWAWGILLVSLALYLLEFVSGKHFVIGTLIVLITVMIPVVLSVVTWIWLGGKETNG